MIKLDMQDLNDETYIEDNRKRSYRHWTTLEDKKLLELRFNGLRFRDIGVELKRTAISVEKRYRKITDHDYNYYV
ncbi:hypothetical protein ACFFIX_12330 [Metabacillus herbersteinensis]|uniref:Myb-like domain-containing protein n=1 Tax=Metabacillus herbersteinensis TaxID=283816 RepID=A0ABV6GEW0_9BACI